MPVFKRMKMQRYTSPLSFTHFQIHIKVWGKWFYVISRSESLPDVWVSLPAVSLFLSPLRTETDDEGVNQYTSIVPISHTNNYRKMKFSSLEKDALILVSSISYFIYMIFGQKRNLQYMLKGYMDCRFYMSSIGLIKKKIRNIPSTVFQPPVFWHGLRLASFCVWPMNKDEGQESPRQTHINQSWMRALLHFNWLFAVFWLEQRFYASECQWNL